MSHLRLHPFASGGWGPHVASSLGHHALLQHGEEDAKIWVYLGVQRRAREEGLVFVAPYDDPLTVAGQGTIGTEILRQV